MPTRKYIGQRGIPSAAAWVAMCQPSASSAIDPKNVPDDDLADHHCGSQRHHEPRSALVPIVLRTEKHVIVRPLVD